MRERFSGDEDARVFPARASDGEPPPCNGSQTRALSSSSAVASHNRASRSRS